MTKHRSEEIMEQFYSVIVILFFSVIDSRKLSYSHQISTIKTILTCMTIIKLGTILSKVLQMTNKTKAGKCMVKEKLMIAKKLLPF